jgi:heme-degrading monooxygenase HmoA
MFAVVFEVLPGDGKKDSYLDLAKHLKPIIETIDGFIDNERYESRRRKGWVLSYSTWRDEKSVVRWRTEGEHHRVQEKGRYEIFKDYHLRVGEIFTDSAPPKNIPVREQRFDETEIGKAKVVTFTEITPKKDAAFAAQTDMLASHLGLDLQQGGVVDLDVYDSIYNPGKIALLVSWQDADVAKRWSPQKIDGVEHLRHRLIRVVRDYGKFDRREAPQFYPDAQGAPTRRPEPAH